ncbi:MAG: UDP-N-acetylmuramate dehydrogenase [Clostridia bacterium]|nr:UDP-N-acetylmuramate dehydrogenase [Clostridia bacterium]
MKDQLIKFITSEYSDRVDIIKDADMKDHTTFRIGGPCDIALFPHDRNSFCTVLDFVNKNGIRYVVIGNGSNVLFSDEGFRGVVIFTTKMKSFSFEDDLLICDAGVQLTAVSVRAVKEGYDGFAFACGIPGSIGGAVYMNAGAYEGQISDILVYSDFYDPKTGKIERLYADDHKLGYRYSTYMDNDRIILGAAFRLTKADDPDSVLALMEDHVRARKEKQPLEYPSAGSTFKRYPGYFTAALIDEAGLKGYSVGGAQVSEKHAGFVINKGGATARDVLELIQIIKDKIYQNKGIHIECEVRYID